MAWLPGGGGSTPTKITRLFSGTAWSKKSGGSPGTVTNTSTVMSRSNCTGSSCELLFYYPTPIDLSKYTTLTMVYINNSYAGAQLESPIIGIISGEPASYNPNWIKNTSPRNSNGSYVDTLDISEYNGTYYIGIRSTYYNFTVGEVTLS